KIPKSVIEKLVRSTCGKDREAADRAGKFYSLGNLTLHFRGDKIAPRLRESFELGLSEVLAAPAENLLKCVEEFETGYSALEQLEADLRGRRVPKEVIDYLLVWIADSGKVDLARLAVARAFLESLDRRLFSEASAEHA